MVLTGNDAYLVIGAIMKITDDIKMETMKFPKGELSEPYRTHINGITKAYILLAKKVLDRISAEVLINSLYFEFEKPVSEYLGFSMPKKLPAGYLV